MVKITDSYAALRIAEGFYCTSVFAYSPKDIHYILWNELMKKNPHLTEMVKVPITVSTTTIKASRFAVWIHDKFYYERKYLKECIEHYNALVPYATKLFTRFWKFVEYWKKKNAEYFYTLTETEFWTKMRNFDSSLDWSDILPMGITPTMVAQRFGKILYVDDGWKDHVKTHITYFPDGKVTRNRIFAKKI